jgi:hypothetical protein
MFASFGLLNKFLAQRGRNQKNLLGKKGFTKQYEPQVNDDWLLLRYVTYRKLSIEIL